MADFVFKRRQRPVHFAWQMDGELQFKEFSAPFMDNVGPQDAVLVGRKFPEVAEALNVDLPHDLYKALNKQRAFSGKTVLWPVCNSTLCVPIDLAAQPVFDEDGKLTGYNGFGMIRSVQARESARYVDPLTALAASPVAAPVAAEAPVEEAPEVEAVAEKATPTEALPPQTEQVSPAEPPVSEQAPAAEHELEDAKLSELADVIGDDGFEPDAFTIADSAPEADIAEPEADTEVCAEATPEATEAHEQASTDHAPHEEDPQIHEALERAAEDEIVPFKRDDDDQPSPDAGMDAFAKAIADLPDAPKKYQGRGPKSLFDLTSNIVKFVERTNSSIESNAMAGLSKPEQDAFNKIADALGATTGAPKPSEVNKRPAPQDNKRPAAEAPAPAAAPQTQPEVKRPVTESSAPAPADNVTRVVTQRPRHELEGEAAARQQAPGRIPDKPQASPIDPRLLDRLPIGVAIVRDRDVVYANDTLLELLGYDRFEALQKAGGLEAIFAEPEECPAPPAETLDRIMHVRLGTGGVRPVDARMHSVPWNGGQALMISLSLKPEVASPAAPAPGVVETAAPSAEAADLKNRVMELESVLETATDGVLVLSRDGRILTANYSAQALFSAEPDEIIGAPLTDYLAPESHRDALDYLEGLASNGVASLLNDGREVIGKASNGGLIPLFMTMGHVSTDESSKYCAVIRDITQWKTAEEELISARKEAESSNAQKSDFLAKISHEIRTPLNAIIGFAEVMQEERFGELGSDRYKEYLADIHRSGTHIMSLLNDLLDLAKIEAGHMELSFEAVSAAETIRECVALLQPQANREKVIIRASLPSSVPRIVADPRALRQITLNLLSNAIKFNKAGGQVIVSLALEPTGEVMLRVRDTGRGMSPSDLDAAMQPFRQINPSPEVRGSGLGLPLTKALAEANRAMFAIESEEGVGTLAEITFPPQRVLTE
ncbi:histidine kinase dimerization/phospho-acceptor domain-containing protein [Pseudovibrio sp. SPO723]|uniref:histidine kinase dimerization/phospho-acceptor domain-containing protein n=1 Tax=Nesiotobacter zosterae TaxID=392721 RepID=UPI0029C12E6F|nr:histidine kinase dimerization/phospho-acceptor domain-containing protein [Pseudovibrio sp. SPO723]MDX5592472.1 histidine kinase dimerization/phospho-acceptor domain-containing protein [Pseudovibrio sp. SPO723]